MKKIVLRAESCIGCGACAAVDEEHFAINEDGFSTVISEENLESEALQDAISACPVAIISLEEQTDNETEDSDVCTCTEDCAKSENPNCTCTSSDCHCNPNKEEKTCDNPECHCNPCTCEDCNCHDEK